MLTPGTIIDNRFEIVSVIGTGGFGTVVKARQLRIDRYVAIKFLKMTLLDVPDGLARFEREAKAINALKHNNIVAFYGYGVWNDTPYMVMEFVEGQTLESMLTQGPLPQDSALRVFSQTCLALDYAHRQGVVHRDLKPSNIMIVTSPGGEESVKLIDFGLVRLMPQFGVVGQKLTETGYALGSCHYMAPEQAMGTPVDQRADIYSLGCIIQQTLTGNRPFDAADNVAIMFQHINEPVPRLENLPNDCQQTAALQILVDNCLAKDPSDRYPDCSALADDIHYLQSKRYSAILPLGQKPTTTKVNRRDSRVITKFIACIAAALTALVVGGFYWLGIWKAPQVVTDSSNSDRSERRIALHKRSATIVELADEESLFLTQSKLEEVERALELNQKEHKLSPRQVFRLSLRLAYSYDIHQTMLEAYAFGTEAKVLAAKVEDSARLALAQKSKISPKDLEKDNAERRLVELIAQAQLAQHRTKAALKTLQQVLEMKYDKDCKCWSPSSTCRHFIQSCLNHDEVEAARATVKLMALYGGTDDKSLFDYQMGQADILMFERQYALAVSRYNEALKYTSTDEVSAFKRSLKNDKTSQSTHTLIINKISALTRLADAEFLLHNFASADKIADQILSYEIEDPHIKVYKPLAHLCLLRIPAAIARGDTKQIDDLMNTLEGEHGRAYFRKAELRETQMFVGIVIDQLRKAGLSEYANEIDDQWMPHPTTDN